MGCIHQFSESVKVTKMWVGSGEVLSPVAMVGSEACILFDILDDRRNPKRSDAERFDVVEILDNAFPVPTVVSGWVREVHIEIVAYIAVCVTVGKDLINDFITPVIDMRRESLAKLWWCHAAWRSKNEGKKRLVTSVKVSMII